ncbi:MAG: hypothetical protein ACRENI_08905 [Gemmatimonadaceae bacterium]
MSLPPIDRQRVLALALLLGVGACDRDGSTEPPTISLDAERVQADVQAMEVMLGSPIWESFSLIGSGGLALGPGVSASLAGAEELVARGTGGGGSPIIGGEVARAVVTRVMTMADVPAVSQVRTIDPGILGTTYVFDTGEGRYVPAPDRTDAPEDGIRFILYAINPVTHQPVVESEIGYADLIDAGSPLSSAAELQLLVVSAGVTHLDYTLTLDGTEDAVSFGVAGYLTDGVTRLDFDIGSTIAMLARGPSVAIDFRFDVPARDFLVEGDTEIAISDTELTQDVELVVHSGETAIRFAGAADLATVNLTVFVNNRIFATITGDHANPEVRGEGGRALTPEEVEALRRMLWLADGAGELLATLLAPIGAIVLLGGLS